LLALKGSFFCCSVRDGISELLLPADEGKEGQRISMSRFVKPRPVMFFGESKNEQVKEVRHRVDVIVDVVLQIKFRSPTKICYTDAILQGTTWLSFVPESVAFW
jgi:hypothetical protein